MSDLEEPNRSGISEKSGIEVSTWPDIWEMSDLEESTRPGIAEMSDLEKPTRSDLSESSHHEVSASGYHQEKAPTNPINHVI